MTPEPASQPRNGTEDPGHDLSEMLEHAAHLLPSQGPITVFVHHNTLHAFEELPFDEAVARGSLTYGCHPYLPEDAYRREVARGRILPEDLSTVLIEDLSQGAELFIGFMGTRYQLRLAMLEHPLRSGPDSELRWLVAESDSLERFREETPPEQRRRIIDQTRKWILEDYASKDISRRQPPRDVVSGLLTRGGKEVSTWGEREWESFSLKLLWRVCHKGVHGIPRFGEVPSPPLRHRDLLLQATGHDIDLNANDLLIRVCAAFLDQGFATWTWPDREHGLFQSFLELFHYARPMEAWQEALPAEARRILTRAISPRDLIEESLLELGVQDGQRSAYITETLLALRGWAGMIWQMETNAEWTAHPAPHGTLLEYLSIRLLVERIALKWAIRETLQKPVDLADLARALRPRMPHPQRVSVDQRAFLVFQLAQIRGWSPADLHRFPKPQWSRLVEEIESFGSLERRRVFHLAYERRFRIWTLDALVAHSRRILPRGPADVGPRPESDRASFQVVCCIDEREESFRRHLEEIRPDCETFGVAGFFGAAMYYKGVAEARFRPLCPVNIKPRHYVVEEPIYSFEDAGRIQAEARRRLGRISHRLHVGTRGFLGGLLTTMVGTLASVPLVMRVLLPRRTASIRRLFGRIVTPPITQLRIERATSDPGSEDLRLGFSTSERAGIVGNVLRAIGMTDGHARLVVIMGHGSGSLNNPQKAAYDCGACGGANGGPNARAFAQMANDHRVRRILADQGLAIAEDVHFVGGIHNTCDDRITYFDLDRIPPTHRAAFELARDAMNAARRGNAHERCRRFESAELTLTPEEALRHVEGRAEDLSQTRPECGHATNALCVVGRRMRTRGLFLDRRAFLTSYDATLDDPESSILAGLLRAVIPVCAGIGLEYYFSRVDPTGYGCGTKLPHNITSLLGVMDGASSDLRPGLPWQMVEIHEPMRLLFIIETSPDALKRILSGEEAIDRLARNGWVQLAVLDPHSERIQLYRDGEFIPYVPEDTRIPVATSSMAWYRGERDHLRFAEIVPEVVEVASRGETPTP